MTPVPGAGSDIFIDANIFLHIILENPSHADSCTALLEHIESGHYRGISSVIVLSEVFHRTFISGRCVIMQDRTCQCTGIYKKTCRAFPKIAPCI